jgi:hypothetical protein
VPGKHLDERRINIVKMKGFLFFKHRVMKADIRGTGSVTFLTSEVDGSVRSGSLFGHFITGERAQGIQWTEGGMAHGAGWNATVKRESMSLLE